MSSSIYEESLDSIGQMEDLHSSEGDSQYSPPPPWQLIDLQDCLHDSPQFRRLLDAKEYEIVNLERKLQKVVQTCSKMIDTGQVYTENCRLFTLSLKELSEHFTQLPSVANNLLRICDIFNDIQSFYSILFDQAQRTVTKGLKDFLTGELKKVHDSKKSFHRTSEDLNNVIHKNANVSRHRPAEADEMSSVLQTTQVEFTHQALDYSYHINLISCVKGHKVIDKLISFLGATSTFFHQGYDALKLLDPFMRGVTSEMDDLKSQSQTDINYMQDRHSLVSSQHFQNGSPEIPLDNPSIPITFSGYLFKRGSNAFKLWNRRYFELRENKIFYLKKDSNNDYGVVADDLRICTVKLADELERRFCFEVVTPSRSCMLQADSETIRRKWVMYLEAGIARALRVTSSNKTREAKESKRRLNTTYFPPMVGDLRNFHRDSPLLVNRSNTPSSLNSNLSYGIDFLEVLGNDRCADCSSPNPKWASLNLGIVLCIDCSGIHRSLGVHISKVRSVTLDDWETEHQKIMCLLGNDRVNSIFEFDIPTHVKKPTCTTTMSDREEYIKLKYVSRAFVHPHPDFVRPEIPIPPPRIQGTLLRSAAKSPKLAGRIPRHQSMSTGLDSHSTPSSPVPNMPYRAPSMVSMPTRDSFGGGLNLPPNNIELLEANWKKLEKSGKLQQWNLTRMYRVVKSPKKSFSFTRFTRPGSFRRKKSPQVQDGEILHSDTELDDVSTPLLKDKYRSSVSPNSLERPQKPPRTYTTTQTDMDINKFTTNSHLADDFSSDLFDTLKRLGSVYSMVTETNMEINENSTNVDTIETTSEHRKIHRSLSAVESLKQHLPNDSSGERNVPKIAVYDADNVLSIRRESLNREMSHSMNSLHSLKLDDESVKEMFDTLKSTTPIHQPRNKDIDTNGECHNNTEMENDTNGYINEEIGDINEGVELEDINEGGLEIDGVDSNEYFKDDDDTSSLDSYQSAEENQDEFYPYSTITPPIDTIRPDSVASDLYHTPPNSMESSPTPLSNIDQAQVTNIGLALGVNILLEDTQSCDDTCHLRDISNLTLIDPHEDEEPMIDYNTLTLTREAGYQTPTRQANHMTLTRESSDKMLLTLDVDPDGGTPLELSTESTNSVEDGVLKSQVLDNGSVEGEDLHGNENNDIEKDCIDEIDDIIIPDTITPTKFIFECSLSGDLGGILCGIAHGGLINIPDPEEGNRYPIHQTCISGNETTAEFVYQNGGKLNVVDDRGCSPLHLAVLNEDASLAAILIKRGANYLCQDKDGKDPLAYALERENADIVTLLKLSKVNDEAKEHQEDQETNKLMEETMAGIYKDFSMTALIDPERMKRRSLSSTNSTPSIDEFIKTNSAPMSTNGSDFNLTTSTSNGSSPLLIKESKPYT